LCNRGINRVIAILLSLAMAALATAGLIWFISAQLAMFSETFPLLKDKFAQLFGQGIGWVSDTFNVTTAKATGWFDKMRGEGLNNSSAMIGRTIGAIGGVFVAVFLLPIYIFMILFYKPLLLDFIGQLFPREKHITVHEVLTQSKGLIQSYLVGLLLEAAIIAGLNSTALLALGIEYAVLLGIIGALLNIIPYIGGLIAISLPVLVALATKPPIYALLVVVAYVMIQLVDNNYIVPKIVASKVKINALVSIVVVLIGGALWGAPGMFLAIPLTAIVKVIFDRIDPLKPVGFLLGDTMPPIGKNIFNLRKPRAIKVKTEV
jgi:predicted PurR-regulated permease PerM